MENSANYNAPPPLPADAVANVHALHEEHPRVRAEDWRSPLVLRLLQQAVYSDGSATIAESFRGAAMTEAITQLPLFWTGLKHDFEKCIRTYQDGVLTEFATLGLACILLSRHTQFRISEVTRRGERVDYWIGDDQVSKRYVLEVGGLQAGSIEALTAEKAEQLNANPWNSSGFICVAIYRASAARLWFYVRGKAA